MEDKYIRGNISTYYGGVEMPGGYTHNIVRTLKRIDLYYEGKFESGEWDEKGNKKLFYNIVKTPCDVASKFTDIDTKDALLYATVPGQDWNVWLMQHDLKQWMKEYNIGSLFNEINMDFPKYGHVFVKKVKNTWKKVNIHNLRFDPSSQSLEKDVWIYEALLMTARDIREMPWNKEAVDMLLSQNQPKYLVYECYDYNLGSGKKWHREFKAGLWDYKQGDRLVRGPEAMVNSESDWAPSIELYEDEVDSLPYRELKWEDVPGRRLGKGFVELLFDNQISENEAENLERKALFFKALQAWYTRDENIGGKNVFDMINGDILLTASDIATLPKDNADLSAYNNTRNRWMENTVAKTFSTDITRGENLPSRTPLGVANLQAGMLTSFFDGKKENFGLFLRQLFLEEIIPSFKKWARQSHTLSLLSTTDGIGKFLQMKSNQIVDELVMKSVMEKGILPSRDMIDNSKKVLLESFKTMKSIPVDIPDSYYEDVKYRFDINFTGEQIDSGIMQQSLMTAMQLVSSNPIIIQNKGTRTMLFKMLELSGVSPIDLSLIEEEVVQNPIEPAQLAQGGSVSAAPPQGNPQVTSGPVEV